MAWCVCGQEVMMTVACTVNAFKARLDKFWQHQLVKFYFTADLMVPETNQES